MHDGLRAGAGLVGRAIGAVVRFGTRVRARSTAVVVAADVDATLMVSAAALRRLGARITRYDTDDAVLEARLGTAHVALRASVEAQDVTRLEISSDTPRAGRLARRFKRQLTRGEPRS